MHPRPAPCPRCNRRLMPAGDITLEIDDKSVTLPVNQCDECLVERELFGEKHEEALTFAIDPSGRAVDPTEPDEPLRLS